MGTLCHGFTHCLSSASAVVGLHVPRQKNSAIKQQRTTPDARFKPWIASPVTAISRLFNEHFPKFDHQQWNYNPLTSQFTFFVTLFYTFSAIILRPIYLEIQNKSYVHILLCIRNMKESFFWKKIWILCFELLNIKTNLIFIITEILEQLS